MRNNKIKESRLVPPDGGWGWIVCFGYALNNVITLPLISGFGLIFQESFSGLGISGTQTAVIVVTNHALSLLLALGTAPLLRRFGYRSIAAAGALAISVGVFLTANATSFVHFLITYSIMTSIGVALAMSAFALAIKSFFRTKRGRAMAASMYVAGLGPIFMPLLTSALLQRFGGAGTVRLLAALALHSFLAALLLRPIKWYLRLPDDNLEKENRQIDEQPMTSPSPKIVEINRSVEYLSENEDDYLEDGKPLKSSTKSLNTAMEMLSYDTLKINNSNPDVRSKNNEDRSFEWWESASVEVNLDSSLNIFDEFRRPSILIGDKSNSLADDLLVIDKIPKNNCPEKKTENFESKECTQKIKKDTSLRHKLAMFFDLGLMRDPIFVNIMVGMSLAACAEINFTLLTPFILSDLSFTTYEIAVVMSVIASADIIFRFVSPFIGEWCQKSARTMYVISLCMLIFSRTTLMFASSYHSMLLVAMALGVSKGVRSVYMSRVMPHHVPAERLAFTSGIQMLTNGIMLMLLGPLLGVIRDRSGSYNIPINVINAVTFVTVLLWVGEFLYVRCFTHKKINIPA